MKSSLSLPRLGLPPPYFISRPSRLSQSAAFPIASSVLLVLCTAIFLLLTYSYTRISPIYRPKYTCPPLPKINTADLFFKNHHSLARHIGRSFPIDERNTTLVIFPTGPRPHRLDADMEIDDWRTSGDAMYIAGELWVANAALAIWMKQGPNCKADAGICLGVALILPELSQREEVFSGSYPSFATHFAESRIHEIWTPGNLSLRISEFERVITKDVSLISHLIDLKEHAVEEDELLITLTMNTARERKNTEELKAIEYASRVATHVHRGIRDVLRHKIRISESTLAAQIKYHSTLCYTRLQAYPPIVGLGRHAAVLHYRVGEDESNGYEGSLPDQPEPSPQTLLVDAASEYMGYASDLTRTWPTRPAADTELIDMVKRIQAAAIKKIKEAKHDIHWSTLVEVATRTLAQELLSHGIFRKGVNVDEILDTQAWKMFMPHGLGHPVGLDVHDPIPNENFLADPSKPTPHHMGFAAPSSGSDYLIVPGMAFTIEPGIYFIPLLWNETSSAGQLVNWTRVREWAAPGVGGARHEDVVIMWHDGSVTVPTSEVV